MQPSRPMMPSYVQLINLVKHNFHVELKIRSLADLPFFGKVSKQVFLFPLTHKYCSMLDSKPVRI